MLRKTRTRTTDGDGGPVGIPGMFDAPDGDAGPVRILNGPYAEELPAGGTTVAQIRSRYRDRFDIDPESLAIVDGDVVGEDTVVRTDQVLTFSRKVGEKGPGRAEARE